MRVRNVSQNGEWEGTLWGHEGGRALKPDPDGQRRKLERRPMCDVLDSGSGRQIQQHRKRLTHPETSSWEREADSVFEKSTDVHGHTNKLKKTKHHLIDQGRKGA